MTKLRFIISLLLAQLPIFSYANEDAWAQYSLRVGVLPSYQNEVTLHQNKEAAEPLLKLISNSQKFLLIHLLSLDCDTATEPFIQKIEEKAKTGTSVHLIINKMYSYLSVGCLKRLKDSGVQISKQRTHSSYWVNDQSELLIGSQSLARMFLLSDGRNNLDRDVMAYVKGPLFNEAILDFVEAWESPLPNIKSFALEGRKTSVTNNKGLTPCYFLSENFNLGVRTFSDSLLYWIPLAQKEIFLSGVKIESGKVDTTKKIRSALIDSANSGVTVSYFGNGAAGGNGELTMVLNEWIEKFPLFSGLLKWLRDKDAKSRYRKHVDEYKNWAGLRNLTIYQYDQFQHYKVWNFDDTSLLVGSANLADESFRDFHEAALFCKDPALVQEWKKAQSVDLEHSEPFQ